MGIGRKCRFATDEMPTYFTSFHLFTHLELTTFGQKRQYSATMTWVGSDDNMEVYITSSESSKPKRFVRRWKKVERKYIQEQ